MVRSLKEFEVMYIRPLVKALHDGFEYIDSYDVNNIDYSEGLGELHNHILESSHALDTAVDEYAENLGIESGFRAAVNRLVIRDISRQSYGSYSLDLSKPVDDYCDCTHAMIRDFVHHIVENDFDGPKQLISDLGTRPDMSNWWLLHNENLNRVRPVNDVSHIHLDAIELGELFEDMKGNDWQACRVYYAFCRNSSTWRSELESCEAYSAIAIPIVNGDLVVEKSKFICDCLAAAWPTALLNTDFDISSERRLSDVVSNFNPNDSPLTLDDANRLFREFSLGADCPDFFESSGRGPHSFDVSTFGLKAQVSIDVADIEPYVVTFWDRQFPDEFVSNLDVFDWDKLEGFVPSVKPVEDIVESVANASDIKPVLQSTDDATLKLDSEGYDITES